MSLRRCLNCTTLYALSLPRCPQCWSDDSIEEGSQMPKITKHGGPSDASLPTPEPAPLEGETPAPPVTPEPTEPPPAPPAPPSDDRESAGEGDSAPDEPGEPEPAAPLLTARAAGTSRRARPSGSGSSGR